MKHPACPDGHTPSTAARWGGGLRLFFRARSARRRKPQPGHFCVATSSKIYGRKRRKSRESERTGGPSVESKYQTSHWARRPERPAARWRAWRRRSDESRKNHQATLGPFYYFFIPTFLVLKNEKKVEKSRLGPKLRSARAYFFLLCTEFWGKTRWSLHRRERVHRHTLPCS